MNKVKAVFRSIFFRDGEWFQPYFWMNLNYTLIVTTIILKLFGIETLSDTMLGIYIGFVGSYQALYNYYNNRKEEK